jgi:hypothetical protein
MRRINNLPLDLSLAHAGIDREGLLDISLAIPLDPLRLLMGYPPLECIDNTVLPDIDKYLSALTQELTAEDIENLDLFFTRTGSDLIAFLSSVDSASFGTIETSNETIDYPNIPSITIGKYKYVPIA